MLSVPNSPPRLFIALQPTDPVRRALSPLADGADGVRWTPGAQIHLTLRFIGEVAEEHVPRIEDALAQVRVRPFHLDISGVGGFPPRGHPAVLWTGVGRGHPLLHQLRQQVDDRLLATGVQFELRSFVPHLTVGRSADAVPVAVAHWLKKHRDFVGPTWPVDAFHLMRSVRVDGTVEHHTLRTYALGA